MGSERILGVDGQVTTHYKFKALISEQFKAKLAGQGMPTAVHLETQCIGFVRPYAKACSVSEFSLHVGSELSASILGTIPPAEGSPSSIHRGVRCSDGSFWGRREYRFTSHDSKCLDTLHGGTSDPDVW